MLPYLKNYRCRVGVYLNDNFEIKIRFDNDIKIENNR